MPTRVRSLLFILLLVLLFAFPAGAGLAAPTPPAPAAATDSLPAPDELEVSIKRGTGVASFARVTEPSTAEVAVAGDPELRARGFLAQYGALFGIRDQAAELAKREVVVDAAGNTHVGFRQVYGGLSVFGGDLRVHLNSAGRVTSAGGAFIPEIAVTTGSAVTEEQAAAAAVAAVQVAHPDATGLAPQPAELLVYRTGLVEGVEGESYLAYRVEVENGGTVRDQVFVDAQTAAVLDRFPMIHDALYREIYSPTIATRVWKEGDPMPSDTEYLNLINGAGETYNLFGSMTNGAWRSYDSVDATMKSIAKYNPGGGYCPNASWNGVNVQFCNRVTGDDTVAHEWGHAYTEYTHNLIYAWQPGALNESYSDIWGETVDLLNARGQDDATPTPRSSAGAACSSKVGATCNPGADNSWRWVSGEDDPGFTCPIRDMWRPECYGDPGKVTSASYQCSTSDGGGVHTNSGVPNHAFALTVDGGTFNGQTITGIGLTKAAHIYWQAQRHYQTNTFDFADHADALVLACGDLIGTPLYDLKTSATGWGATTAAITQTDCDQLDKVALAVQFRTAPNCSFTPMFQPNPPALCSAGNGPQNHLFQDFEAGLGAWTAQQTPSNPATWDDRPWHVVANAPDAHPGSAAFGPNPVVGDCSTDLDNGVTSLLSPVIAIPANAAAPVRMAWDHLVSMEIQYDGGNLKASVNGGAFNLVPASAFTFNAYSASLLASGNDNPMAGQAAWTGGDGGAVTSKWGQSQLNLSQIGVDPGDTVRFRWDVGSDGCNGWDGWYVDDVRVYSCAPCVAPSAPAGLGISKPNPTTVNLAWSAAANASKYEVWSAANAPFFDPSGKTCANPAPYACAETSSLGWSASDLGNATVNHTYVVRAANACGQTSAASTRVAEFEYLLEAGN